jgi:flavin-dependent dehydrogenase
VRSLQPRELNFRSARTDRLESFSGDYWVAVGDAAVACDPLGSQGLIRALESAAMAFEWIVKNRTSDSKNTLVYSDFLLYYLEQFLGERHHYYSTERRWPDAPFWRTHR